MGAERENPGRADLRRVRRKRAGQLRYQQTTSYSAAQLAAWIDVLGPAMAAIGVKVMAPETMNGCGFPGYFPAIQNNTAAWTAVNIFASHEYGCGAA